MRRHDNWPRLLADYIDERRDAPFAWGSNDCGHFAAGAVRAITGEDLVARLNIGAYATEAEARALRGELGPLDEWPGKAGLSEIPVASAQRGDLMLGGDVSAFGICLGVRSAFVTCDGLEFIDTFGCIRAWRV